MLPDNSSYSTHNQKNRLYSALLTMCMLAALTTAWIALTNHEKLQKIEQKTTNSQSQLLSIKTKTNLYRKEVFAKSPLLYAYVIEQNNKIDRTRSLVYSKIIATLNRLDTTTVYKLNQLTSFNLDSISPQDSIRYYKILAASQGVNVLEIIDSLSNKVLTYRIEAKNSVREQDRLKTLVLQQKREIKALKRKAEQLEEEILNQD